MKRNFLSTEIQTHSGKAYDYAKADAHRISINDITNALAQICRYGGHCKHFFSVAAHSYLVGSMMELLGESEEACFYGFVHDFPEAVYCDLPRPMKNQLEGAGLLNEYKKLEEDFMQRFYDNLNIRYPVQEAIDRVKLYDILALEFEMANVLTQTNIGHEHLIIRDKNLKLVDNFMQFSKIGDAEYPLKTHRYDIQEIGEQVFSYKEGDFAYAQYINWGQKLRDKVCNYV